MGYREKRIAYIDTFAGPGRYAGASRVHRSSRSRRSSTTRRSRRWNDSTTWFLDSLEAGRRLIPSLALVDPFGFSGVPLEPRSRSSCSGRSAR